MFKYLPLLWANLGRKRLRTGLTLASIIVAFLLFGLMQTLRVALTGSPDLAGVDRLVTMHKIVASSSRCRESYLNRIRARRRRQGGVARTTGSAASTRTTATRSPRLPSTCRRSSRCTPSTSCRPSRRRAGSRTAPAPSSARWSRSASAGRSAIPIPLRSNIWTQKDGGNVWPMKIVGIYDAGQRRQPEPVLPSRLPGRVARPECKGTIG